MIATNGFLAALECTKFVFGTTIPRLPSRLGEGNDLTPFPHDVDTFGSLCASTYSRLPL